MITGRQLADYAISTLGKPYMYGNNGWIITEKLIQSTKARTPAHHYTPDKVAHLRKFIGVPGYQCNTYLSVMLEKERSSNGWRDYGKGGPISTIPDVVGVSVFYEGHTGIYIGNGEVLEARGVFHHVVITKLKDRPWTDWRMFEEIDYQIGGEIMLKKGNKGEAVYDYQKLLVSLGYKIGAFLDMKDKKTPNGCDGSFGGYVETATKELEKSYKLTQTGVVTALLYGRVALNLSEKSEKLRKDIAKNQSEISALSVTLKDKNIRIANMEHIIDNYSEKIQLKDDEIAGLYALKESLVNDVSRLQASIDDKTEEVTRLTVEFDICNATLLGQKAISETLRTELEATRETLECAQKELEEIKNSPPEPEEPCFDPDVPEFTISELLHMLVDRIFKR